MVQETDISKLPLGTKVIPSEDFVLYCEAEFERRLNSGDDFDAETYQQVMEEITGKLKALETGETA
jgi:hypothetical protein